MFYASYQQPRLSGVRILVVRNLPTGPQLRSASFQSANYTYAGPHFIDALCPQSAAYYVSVLYYEYRAAEKSARSHKQIYDTEKYCHKFLRDKDTKLHGSVII